MHVRVRACLVRQCSSSPARSLRRAMLSLSRSSYSAWMRDSYRQQHEPSLLEPVPRLLNSDVKVSNQHAWPGSAADQGRKGSMRPAWISTLLRHCCRTSHTVLRFSSDWAGVGAAQMHGEAYHGRLQYSLQP